MSMDTIVTAFGLVFDPYVLLVIMAFFFYAAGATVMAWISVAWLVPVLLGGGLVVLGQLGRFFSRLLQRIAVRHHTFLADTAALRITRYPAALERMLHRIARHDLGSRILAPAAARMAPLFVASPAPPPYLSALLETHPPIEARRRRLQANALPPEPLRAPVPPPVTRLPSTTGATLAPLQWGRAVLDDLPRALYDAVHDLTGAQAILLGLLLSTDEATCRRQVKLLAEGADPLVIDRLSALQPDLRAQPPATHLPIVELTAPVLRALSLDQRYAFRRLCERLARADDRLFLFESCLYLLLDAWLNDAPALPPLRRPRDVRTACGVLLSALAWSNRATPPDARRAFEVALTRLPAPMRPALLHRERLTHEALGAALKHLSRAVPPMPSQVVDASTQAVLADGAVTIEEAELLRTIAVHLNRPLPPLLAGLPAD